MRVCRLVYRPCSAAALFAATPRLLAAARKRKLSPAIVKDAGGEPRGATGDSPPATESGSLATFAPAIAATWMAAASTKMLQPHHVTPDSRKLAWWCCPACAHQFNKRIDLHVARGGECPACGAKPLSLTSTRKSKSGANGETTSRVRRAPAKAKAGRMGGTGVEVHAVAAPVVAHRCRPDSSQATLAVENANRIKKSVADGSYLRHQEKRNLMPMLAKSYEKEAGKIAEGEIVAVSPKLDGIRCVTAYDPAAKRILFFSRAGTLFECCDAKIEPYLEVLFEADPTLVLDGELYNDSANLHRMAGLLHGQPRARARGGGGDPNASLVGLFSDETLRVNARLRLPGTHTTTAVKRGRGGSAAAAEDDAVIGFDQLTSAIRTTRDRRTAEHERLQRRLQYHVFDLLYSREYPTAGDSLPFRYRYAYLAEVLARAHDANCARGRGRPALPPSALPYDAGVLRLVPSLFCTKAAVDGLLRAAMAVGYEGVMVRRDGLRSAATGGGPLTLTTREVGAEAVRSGRGGGSRAVPSLPSPSEVRSRVAAAQAVVQSNLRDDRSTGVGAGGGYGYGQRSSTLLKYKVMQDAEFVIVSAVEGKGKWTGSLGAFVCKTRDGKKTFTVTPASTDSEKKRMWETWEKAYKGRALTVQYQELTADGIPRFPVGKAVRGAANGQDWI